MPTFGVYPVADAQLEGEEISSTYEGRHVTVLESELIHKAGNVGGFVDKGNPVIFGTPLGHGIGIAFTSAAAATDLVAVDTEGIWIVDVVAADDGGNRAIAGGDVLYINTTTAVVSAIATGATQIPFGYALGIIATPGNIERIAVKLHWSPVDNWVRDLEEFYFGDSLDCNFVWGPGIITQVDTLLLTNAAVGVTSSAFQISATAGAGTNDVGIAAYFDATANAVATGNWVYGFGAWLNLGTTFDAPAGAFEIVAQDNGVYCGTVVDIATATVMYGLKAECIMTAQPANIYAFGIYGNQVGSARTALFYANNTAIVNYNLANKSGVAGGSIGFIVVNGDGYGQVLYVNTFRN